MAEGWSGMRGISAVPTYVVMQPTTLCNLDCAYCYLPFRAADRRLPVEVARAAAASVPAPARGGLLWGPRAARAVRACGEISGCGAWGRAACGGTVPSGGTFRAVGR